MYRKLYFNKRLIQNSAFTPHKKKKQLTTTTKTLTRKKIVVCVRADTSTVSKCVRVFFLLNLTINSVVVVCFHLGIPTTFVLANITRERNEHSKA